jgi:hypothetical protein
LNNFFLTDFTHSLASLNFMIRRLCHSPIQYVVMTNSINPFVFCALGKYVSHICHNWETNADSAHYSRGAIGGNTGKTAVLPGF